MDIHINRSISTKLVILIGQYLTNATRSSNE